MFWTPHKFVLKLRFIVFKIEVMDLAITLAHYFYPRYSNNHRAKILHSSSLVLLAFFLIVYQVILDSFPLVGVRVLGYAANISSDEVIRLTNEKRNQAGVGSLQPNVSLAQAARAKGEHMLANDYWAHTAPDGTEPWKFFVDVGYKYRYAGENLARDFSNPASAVEAWMASPSHKDNLLSGKYKEIGVAVVEGDLGGVDTTIVVQLFGSQLVDTAAPIPVAQAGPENSPSPTTLPVPTEAPAPLIALISPEPTQNPGGGAISTLPPVEKKASGFEVLISPFETSRGVSIATTIVLLSVMVIDGVIVARRKITRVGGRTFAHLAFLGMILAIILMAKAGEIL